MSIVSWRNANIPTWTWDLVLAVQSYSFTHIVTASVSQSRLSGKEPLRVWDLHKPPLSPQLTSMCLGPSWWTWSPEPWTASGLGPLGNSSDLTTSSLLSIPCPTLIVNPIMGQSRSTGTKGHSCPQHNLAGRADLPFCSWQWRPREMMLCTEQKSVSISRTMC